MEKKEPQKRSSKTSVRKTTVGEKPKIKPKTGSTNVQKKKIEKPIIEEPIMEEKLEKKIKLNIMEEQAKSSKSSGAHFGLRARVIFSVAIQGLLVMLGAFCLILASNNMITHNFLYNETSRLDYQVCYIENEFFTEECVPRGRQYIANLINYIDTTFNYRFSGSDLIDYTYTYSVTATIIANERGQANRILFDREDILLPERIIQMTNSTGFEINENIRIDYRYFNNIINNFRREYVLLLDSEIIVTLNVRIDGVHQNIEEPILIEREVSIVIPLSEQTLNVSITYEDINNSYVMHVENENERLSMIYYVLATISFGLMLVLMIQLIRLMLRAVRSTSAYKKKLDKIMREFGLVIVETKSVPQITSQKIYEIISMEELLDVQNVLQKPIMHIKIHDEKSCFMITNNEEVYRYTMKAVDVTKERDRKY